MTARFVPVNDPRPGQMLYCSTHERMELACRLYADTQGEPFKTYACNPPYNERGLRRVIHETDTCPAHVSGQHRYGPTGCRCHQECECGSQRRKAS